MRPLDDNPRLAAECRAAAPRFSWDGQTCRSRTKFRPVIDPDAQRKFGHINSATVELRHGTTLAQTEELARSVGGRVLEKGALRPDDAEYAELELATTTQAELFGALKRLEASSLVTSALPPIWGQLSHGGVHGDAQNDCASGGRAYRVHGLVCESVAPARPRVGPGRGRGSYVNQAVLRPRPGTTLGQLEGIAASVGGRVVRRNYLEDLQGEVWLEVPATTDAELDAILARLQRDPRVASAGPQPVPAAAGGAAPAARRSPRDGPPRQ